jgi:2-polyprenyl-6-methoxyphenol hydroxylase-like FAD-dependent oxidoreductase
MTDVDGHVHRNMLPIGKIRPEVWEAQLKCAREFLPAAFTEVIEKTKKPFAAVINDHLSSKATFFGGKLLLVGDGLSLFRPHVALSTNQAALHALQLAKVMRGEMSLQRWEGDALRYAKATGLLSTLFGSYGQAGIGKILLTAVRYLLCIVGHKISWLWRRK